jgi:hypothetical protein
MRLSVVKMHSVRRIDVRADSDAISNAQHFFSVVCRPQVTKKTLKFRHVILINLVHPCSEKRHGDDALRPHPLGQVHNICYDGTKNFTSSAVALGASRVSKRVLTAGVGLSGHTPQSDRMDLSQISMEIGT